MAAFRGRVIVPDEIAISAPGNQWVPGIELESGVERIVGCIAGRDAIPVARVDSRRFGSVRCGSAGASLRPSMASAIARQPISI